MKKIILLSVLSIFAFTACEKDYHDADLPEEKERVKDLVVSQNFDWEMTQQVTVNLTAPVQTPACVYVNQKCTDKYKIIDYTIIPGLDMPISVKVPAAIRELWVKYGDGIVESIPLKAQQAKMALPATQAITRGWEEGNNEVLMYAGKNWSTLMFEDLFPRLGDYDFNDLVANYNYSVVYVVSSLDQDNMNASHVLGYQFEFRVNAVGATLPITPYLKVTTKNNKLMRAFNVINTEKLVIETSDESIKAEVVASGEGYHIYKFVGMTEKPSNVFVNTEVGQTLSAPKIIKVEAHTVDNQGIKWDEAYDANVLEFDFFITNGTDEIHNRGFEPTGVSGVRAYPAGQIEGGAGELYYSNGDNLIWGLDVPAVINHATEKTNFLEAYPLFKGWATSGGAMNTDWYNSPVSSQLIDYMKLFPIQ